MSTIRTIPVVDIADLYSTNPALWSTVDQAIGHALSESGAFVASGIPKPARPDREQTQKLLAFYNLPQEVRDEVGIKRLNPASTRAFRGYSATIRGGWAHNEMYDIGPVYNVTGPAIPDVEQLIESNAWPSVEPQTGWQDEMTRYHDQMHDFSKRIMRSIIRYLGANEDTGAARFDHSNSTLRLLNYPPLPDGLVIGDQLDAVREFGGEQLRVMAREHTDQCCLTLLWQSDVGGLQMQSPSGEWQAIPSVEDGVSIHLGMAMESMSEQVFAATPHRVLGKGNARQSIGFFLEPNLRGSVRPFSKATNEPPAADEDTYAAALLRTIADRIARKKAKKMAEE